MSFYRIAGAALLGFCLCAIFGGRSDRRGEEIGKVRGVSAFLQCIRNGIGERLCLRAVLEEAVKKSHPALRRPAASLIKSMEDAPAADFDGLWRSFSADLPLSKEDQSRVASLGPVLGSEDGAWQIRRIEGVIRALEKHADEEEEALRGQRRLYSKIGVLLSLLLMVILL